MKANIIQLLWWSLGVGSALAQVPSDVKHRPSWAMEGINRETPVVYYSALARLPQPPVVQTSDTLPQADQSRVEAHYQERQIHGPYPVGQGDKSAEYGLEALWQTAVDPRSQFFAKAAVSKGVQQNILFNAMRFGHLYGPYTMTTKRQADFKYQQYQLAARYATDFKGILWSVEVDYTGDYAHTETDPRAKDVSAWLGLSAAVRYPFKQHHIDLSVGYQHHTKNVDLDVWQGNAKYQFLLLRGFGLYDHDFTESVFNKKRQYSQNLFEMGVGASLWKRSKSSWELQLNWGRSQLKTEEQNTINLHQLESNTLTATVVLKQYLSAKWQAYLSGEFSKWNQKGTENRYTLTKVNADFAGIYDYVKIGAVEPYRFRYDQYHAAVNLEYKPDGGQRLVLLLGYGKTALVERYKGTDFYTQIDKSRISTGMSYSRETDNNQWDLDFKFLPERTRKAISNKDTSVESLYDQIYLPQFHYNSSNRDTYTLRGHYAFKLSTLQKIGIAGTLTYGKIVNRNPQLDTDIQPKETFFTTSIYWTF